jgi:hypothetical protein
MAYTGRDNAGKPKSDYVAKIAAMDDAALFKETEMKIWLSAFASNNPRSDYHWHIDAAYDEWVARGKVGEYQRAYEKARRTCG